MPPVSDPNVPSGLTTILAQMDSLVRQAFAEGYHHGVTETRDRMFRASIMGTEQRLGMYQPAMGQPVIRDNISAQNTPFRDPYSGHTRPKKHGTIIARVREALLAAGGVGVTAPELLTFCRNSGLDVTPTSIKEAIRQLVGREEVARRGGTLYAGPRLQAYEVDVETAAQTSMAVDEG